MKKQRILIISLLVACLSLGIGGTLAFFTTTDTARNVITAGNIKIELIETDKEGNPFEGVSGITPGTAIDKIVTVKNTSENPCWVRISVKKEIILAEDTVGDVDLSLIDINFNTEDWTEKDGFYYYNAQLNPDETTVPLFTKVTLVNAMNNLYKRSTANVEIVAYAVQCANNGTSVLEANGWPEE